MRHMVLVFYFGLILNSCCIHGAVIQHEGLSRTYLTLNIEKLSRRYESIRVVGGEHMDVYYFMVPEDSVFELSISSTEGHASAYLQCNDETLWSTSENSLSEQRYTIVGQNLWRYKLSVMAHPVDTYTLRIYKTKKGS